jgi:hypothetical protein
MKAYAIVDEEGIPKGGGVLRAIPDGAVLLPAPWTVSDLSKLRYRNGLWEERTDLPVDDVPTPTAEDVAMWQAEMLARAKADATARVNARAGATRLKVYTDIPGQDAMYLEKRAEALAFLAAVPEPKTLDDYPLIRGEVGLTAPTAYELAQIWLNRAYLFKLVGGATETARLRATSAIATAPDEATIAAIEAEANAAFASLPI